MTGWIVINGFMVSPKFQEIYQMFVDAFGRRNISLEIKTNADILLEINQKIQKEADFILFWDKDVRLAKHLEQQGFRLFNQADSIEACDDKGLTAILLENSGIEMPRTIVAPMTYPSIGYSSLNFADKIIKRLNFPIIVKESRGSFGQQVYLAETKSELLQLISKIVPNSMIFQQFISSSFGKDVRIYVIGDEVVASVARRGKEGDFRANVTNGGRMIPFEVSSEMKTIALKAAKCLNLDYAGIDILFGPNNKPILCEVNSNAHFKNLYNATGINLSEKLADHILKKLK
ncbi:MAG: RimK family alpha-L-glutamate ligase [Planctomycetia bacterium]|nr:RimK family alpha-L-glutamate ligase [Planctomycetia bacterium]